MGGCVPFNSPVSSEDNRDDTKASMHAKQKHNQFIARLQQIEDNVNNSPNKRVNSDPLTRCGFRFASAAPS